MSKIVEATRDRRIPRERSLVYAGLGAVDA
jgi:hypothetical protein